MNCVKSVLVTFNPWRLIPQTLKLLIPCLNRIIISIIFLLLLLMVFSLNVTGEEKVLFADKNLEKEIRKSIDKPEGDIYQSDLEDLTELEAKDNEISNLKGLDNCKNLMKLLLGQWSTSNQVEDLSYLKGLIRLKELDLRDNKVTDISPISGLYNLEKVDLRNNYLDLSEGSEDKKSIDKLEEKGVDVSYKPQKAAIPAFARNLKLSSKDNAVTIKWINPNDSRLRQLIIRRKTSSYPENHTDGQKVNCKLSSEPAASNICRDRGLAAGRQYYYAVFTKGPSGNWNDTIVTGINANNIKVEGTSIKAYRNVHFRDSKNMVKEKIDKFENMPYKVWEKRSSLSTSGVEIAGNDFEFQFLFFNNQLYQLEVLSERFWWKGPNDKQSIRATKELRDFLVGVVSNQYGAPSTERKIDPTKLPSNEIIFSHIWGPERTETEKEIKIGIKKNHGLAIEFQAHMTITHTGIAEAKKAQERQEEEEKKEETSRDF